MMSFISKIVVGVAVGVSGLFGFLTHHNAPTAGNFNPTGAGTYLLQSSISASQSTIVLTSFEEPGSNIPYTMSYINTSIAYGTIAPSSGGSEFVSFTGITQNVNGTATLTGVLRGLSRTPGTGGCVASTTLARAFPGQTQFILSNSPCFYAQYAVKANNEYISGVWGFGQNGQSSTSPVSQYDYTNKAYVDNSVVAGAPAAGYTVPGIGFIATKAQIAAGTATTTYNAINYANLLTAQNSTSTCQVAQSNVIVASSTTGKLDKGCFDQTANYALTGTSFSVSGTSTLATSTMASTTVTNGLNVGASATTTFNGGGIDGIINYQSFTASGTWTKPTNITGNEMVRVQMWGSGAGGGGCTNNSSSASGGGGGGAFVQNDFKASDLTSTVTVTVPAGGTGASGNATGGSPAAVTFGALLSANSGTGGAPGNGGNGNGGAGGVAGTGYPVSVAGQTGANGGASTPGAIAAGGPAGGGGAAGAGTGTAGGTNTIYVVGAGGAGNTSSNSGGVNATGNAAGGGGCGSNGNTETGGNGTIGIVRVWTYR